MINAGTLIVCVSVAFALGLVAGMMLCHLDREDRRRNGPPKGTGGSSEGWRA